jgi:hypothetical protein
MDDTTATNTGMLLFLILSAALLGLVGWMGHLQYMAAGHG